MRHDDTIFALASAPGKSGVAIIRISGVAAPQALVLLGVTKALTPRMATRVTLIHKGAVLDHALALYFIAPHSFTGEDVVELHIHGSRAITRQLLDALAECEGLRLAEPGEFTRRAYMHGKMDLLQAESLADLIDADTATQHHQAMRQLDEASARVMHLREAVLTPLALLEAYIDFPDEEIPESTLQKIVEGMTQLREQIRGLLDDGGIGEKLREGLRIVIFGPPNAGKSSLLNYLAKREAAIVSEHAGTTRDVIEVQMDIGGYAVTLTDTAGMREAANDIEAEGVRRAKQHTENADIKLAVFDIVTISEQINDFRALIDERTLLIANKADLNSSPSVPPQDMVYMPISIQTGEGITQLIEALKERLHLLVARAPSPLITRARHRQALIAALAALESFSTNAPLEIMCEELRVAASEIGKITGKIQLDDVLDLIFKTFCIGK